MLLQVPVEVFLIPIQTLHLTLPGSLGIVSDSHSNTEFKLPYSAKH